MSPTLTNERMPKAEVTSFLSGEIEGRRDELMRLYRGKTAFAVRVDTRDPKSYEIIGASKRASRLAENLILENGRDSNIWIVQLSDKLISQRSGRDDDFVTVSRLNSYAKRYKE